jgi:sterol desaturase/sphingolipid hydroxylase (fatty acid hydroxylase superfamily)
MEQFEASTRFLYFLPLAILAIVLESWFYARRFQTPYPWQDSLTSLGVGVGHQIAGNINLFLIQGLMGSYVWAHRVFTMPNTGWSLAALFLLLDFFYYGYHRAAHEVNVMWATHSTHHSPNEMALTASLRLGWTPFFSFSWLFFLPLVWLGFSVHSVFSMLSFSLLYQFWLHTRLIGKLGPLEGILNTPSAHRVHHARNAKFLDKNYGGFLMVFDRLFGTYAEEGEESEIQYGLVHPNTSKNPFNVVFKNWGELLTKLRTLRGIRNKTRVIFSKPGNIP